MSFNEPASIKCYFVQLVRKGDPPGSTLIPTSFHQAPLEMWGREHQVLKEAGSGENL